MNNKEIHSYIANKISIKVKEQIKENKDTDLIRYDVYQQFKNFGYQTVKDLIESELKKYPSYKGIIPNVAVKDIQGTVPTINANKYKQVSSLNNAITGKRCFKCMEFTLFENGGYLNNKYYCGFCAQDTDDDEYNKAINRMEKQIAESERLAEVPYYDQWDNSY